MEIDHSKKYYEQSSFWSKNPKGDELKRVNKIISLVPKDVKTILDVGCGNGVVINRLQNKGFNCTGIDTSKEALKHVKCKRKIMYCNALNFRCNSFNLVICAEVLEHLQEGIYENTIKEIERVSNKYILITAPYKEDLRLKFTKCSNCGTTYHIYKHIRSFNENCFKKLFTNFKLKRITYIGKVKKQNIVEKYLRYRLGDFYIDSKTAICPACNYKNDYKRRYNLFSSIAALSYRVIPHKIQPHWIVGLFENINGCKNNHCL